MVFQPKYSLGLILSDHTTPVEPGSESVTSTIPTKRQNKPSKIDRVGQVIDNAGFQLVTNSGNTQPKTKTKSFAPPHPIRYFHTVILQDPLGQYQEGTAPLLSNQSAPRYTSHNGMLRHLMQIMMKLVRKACCPTPPPTKKYSNQSLLVNQVPLQSRTPQQQNPQQNRPRTTFSLLPYFPLIRSIMTKSFQSPKASSNLIQSM